MSDNEPNKPQAEGDDGQQQPADAASTEQATEAPIELASAEELNALLITTQDELEAAKSELKDSQLRAQAELQNVRRRATQDVEKARKFGAEKLANELLPVKDSLDMGMEAANADGADIASIKEGMELTARQLLSAMEKIGIAEINPVGEQFNPELHEAMMMQPSADAEPNTVITVFRKGFTLHGRMMRPAQVIVAAPA